MDSWQDINLVVLDVIVGILFLLYILGHRP